MTIEASETDLSIADVHESELFPVEELGEFRIRLCNGGGMGEIIDFAEWVKKNRKNDKIKIVPLAVGGQRHWIFLAY